MSRPRVAILSLQGDFARHREAIESLGAEARRVTLPQDLEGADALILPGGESTTMLRLLESTGLRAPLEAFVRTRPVLGTCAGVILLGCQTAGLPAPSLGAIDVGVERNAYGRQIDSFTETIDTTIGRGTFEAVFIRAPRIRRVGPGVEVIARRRGAAGATEAGEPVGVRSGRVVGLCFHPELTADASLHHWFLTEVAGLALSEAPANAVRVARGVPA